MNFLFDLSTGTRGDWLPYVAVAWLAIFLINLGLILKREDFDSVTRLTWAIVVIFVPFFGVILYWCLTHESAPKRSRPLNDLSGTPWEK